MAPTIHKEENFSTTNLKWKMTLVQPSGELSAKIKEELREPANPADIDRDIGIIREWLGKQPHLPKDMDDARLRTFLRGCKFSLERVKQKLDMYYTMRNAVPEFFTERDVTRQEMSEVLNVVHMPPLPGLTPAGCRVVMLRGTDKDISTPNVIESMKLTLMIGDIRLAEESVGVAGDVYILDASVATPTHFAKFTPTLVKKFLICVQEAYPVKLKEVHVVNVSPIVDTIVNFVKPFLKEKIRERIHIHSSMEDLYKFVPKAMLPSEYGGDAGSIKDLNEQWRVKLSEYTAWFKEQEESKANESLRPGAPKTADELFGMDGTFRQLTID
ncbi:alpha-tocopherol transfer protein-like isoform X1 [Ochlerotatus camptorhynchus]|uniref:alpha-tocopherol transfer protein-like isoform X1 n=2 Tax=Ochlerotatus camptorhynchus TaxID=644619 RepID=UPI0031CF59F7